MLKNLQVFFLDTLTPDGFGQARVMASFDDRNGISKTVPIVDVPEFKDDNPANFRPACQRIFIPLGTKDESGLDYFQVDIAPVKLAHKGQFTGGDEPDGG